MKKIKQFLNSNFMNEESHHWKGHTRKEHLFCLLDIFLKAILLLIFIVPVSYFTTSDNIILSSIMEILFIGGSIVLVYLFAKYDFFKYR